MPPVVAAVAAIAAVIGEVVGAGALLSAVAGSVVSFGLSAASSLLSQKKKASLGSYSFADSASGRTQVVRSPIESHKVLYGRVRVSGPLVFATTTSVRGHRNGYLHLVICLAAHEIDAIETIYINDEAVTFFPPTDTFNGPHFVSNSRYLDRDGTSFVRIKKYLGTETQAADADLLAEVPGWTSDHRLRGTAYLYVRLLYDRTMFANGIPNISATIRGKKLYDPRTASSVYSDNWALCVRDYLSNAQYGLGAADTLIDDASVIAAANVADELVTLVEGATQKRYTCHGVINTADKPLDILKSLASGGAGVVAFTQGKYRLFAGAYRTPGATLDTTWLSGEVKVQARQSRNELFNAVKGVYVDPNKQWQPTDFPMVTNATYEAQDGGVRIARDLELPFTTHPEAAQRIAKIALEKSRQGILVEMPCNLKAVQVAVWDTVLVNLAQLGWSNKIFRVMKWTLEPEKGVVLTLQEESAASYDWNQGEASVLDAAPDTNLPDATYVAPPGNPAVSEELYVTTNGSGVKSRARLSWDAGEDTFAYRFVLQYKQSAEAEAAYRTVGDFITPQAVIDDLAPALYHFRVKAINWRGQQSEWATTQQEIFGLTAPPSDIAGFTLNAVHNQAHLQWDAVPDIDVRVGGAIKVTWSSKTSGATWSNGVDLGPNLPGIATNAVVPLLSGTYMIKALDSSGNESRNAASISSTVANVVNMNALLTSQQDNSFPGTKTNMIVSSGKLKLDGTTLFDSATGNLDDSAGNFDGGGTGGTGFATSGEYRFDDGSGHAYQDLGQVLLSRVTADIDAIVVDESTSLEDAAGNFDDREGLFDGSDLSDVDLKLYVRTTPDNPASSPVWSDWRQFVVGDYEARAYDFKLLVASGKASNNVEVSTLRVHIDVPDREEHDEDVTTATGGDTTITFAQAFQATPNVAITMQNLATGDYYTLTSRSSTGFTVNAYNSAGTRVARTFDWLARGY